MKIRSGPPKDSAKDLGLGYWTGVIPLDITPGEAIPDPVMEPGKPAPEYVVEYKRPHDT